MKNEWNYIKNGHQTMPVYELEQSASLQYWKERYLWLLERYNQVLEKNVRNSYEKKQYLNIKL